MIPIELCKLHSSHLIEPNNFETRLKYCIQYRGAIPEGREKSIFHLVEIVWLRYYHTTHEVDIYDHNSHLMASFSNWLFEHFPDATSFLSLLARRRWLEAAKHTESPLKKCLASAPIFGNARQMSTWRHSLIDQCFQTDPKLVSGDLNYIKQIIELSWLEKLSIAAIFSVEPIFDLSKQSIFFFDRNFSDYDRILLDIMCKEPITKSINRFYYQPKDLWLPVHINLILDEQINEFLLIRYVQHLLATKSMNFPDKMLAFDYLLRCKENGSTISNILMNHLGLGLNNNEKLMLLEKVENLKLGSLQEDLVLFWNYMDSFNLKLIKNN